MEGQNNDPLRLERFEPPDLNPPMTTECSNRVLDLFLDLQKMLSRSTVLHEREYIKKGVTFYGLAVETTEQFGGEVEGYFRAPDMSEKTIFIRLQDCYTLREEILGLWDEECDSCDVDRLDVETTTKDFLELRMMRYFDMYNWSVEFEEILRCIRAENDQIGQKLNVLYELAPLGNKDIGWEPTPVEGATGSPRYHKIVEWIVQFQEVQRVFDYCLTGSERDAYSMVKEWQGSKEFEPMTEDVDVSADIGVLISRLQEALSRWKEESITLCEAEAQVAERRGEDGDDLRLEHLPLLGEFTELLLNSSHRHIV